MHATHTVGGGYPWERPDPSPLSFLVLCPRNTLFQCVSACACTWQFNGDDRPLVEGWEGGPRTEATT